MKKALFYSYAKLNLHLKVIKKRKDGFHEIETLFERIDLADRIILSPRPDKKIRIISSNPALPKDKSNLCYLSAKLLQDKLNIQNGVDIRIEKRIPIGAGLAGGSSNAATVFLGLNKLWRLGLSRSRLMIFSRELGCDIPFFIQEVSFALGRGRGDQIKPLNIPNMPKLWHLLIVPKVSVSTALIYRKWDNLKGKLSANRVSKLQKISKKALLTTKGTSVKMLTSILDRGRLVKQDKLLFNSLEAVTVRLYPQVNKVKKELQSSGLKSILMSGSGPAVFAIVSSRKEALSLSRKIRGRNRSWQVFVTRTE